MVPEIERMGSLIRPRLTEIDSNFCQSATGIGRRSTPLILEWISPIRYGVFPYFNGGFAATNSIA